MVPLPPEAATQWSTEEHERYVNVAPVGAARVVHTAGGPAPDGELLVVAPVPDAAVEAAEQAASRTTAMAAATPGPVLETI